VNVDTDIIKGWLYKINLIGLQEFR
jgi:hypothetical protein